MKYQILTHNGIPVDFNKLSGGIYGTNNPKLFGYYDTIEGITKHAKTLFNDLNGGSFVTESFLTNLAQCEFKRVRFFYEEEVDLIESAVQFYFADAINKLERKDLGDIERDLYLR